MQFFQKHRGHGTRYPMAAPALRPVLLAGRLSSTPHHLRMRLNDLFGITNSLHSDQEHLDAAIDWLCRAQDIAGDGVSAGYYCADGWLPPYPETTGYIIPTFCRLAHFLHKPELSERAVRMADWECKIQLPSGGVRGGIGINTDPVVFNTGQVILGWLHLFEETADQKLYDAALAAANWLLIVQDWDGKWTKYTHANRPHAYHSRVAWALLEVNKHTHIEPYRHAAEANLKWVLAQADRKGWFQNASFDESAPAFTHTIAYTFRGLLEAARYCESSLRNQILEVVHTGAETMMLSWERSKRDPRGEPPLLPGAFTEGWQPALRASCLTGSCQLAIVWMKLYQIFDDIRFLNAALKLLDQVKRTQSLTHRHPGVRGGISGSYPFWGQYERFGYPNWAAKFFVDALLLQEELMSQFNTGEGSL
jgi:hypothetical protein